MSWHLDTTRIFVQEKEGTVGNIIARLQPLSSGTVLHRFGNESLVINLRAIVVGFTDISALRDMTETGTSYTLYRDGSATSNFFVNKVADKLLPAICQTIRPDLPEDEDVFDVSIELYLDEA